MIRSGFTFSLIALLCSSTAFAETTLPPIYATNGFYASAGIGFTNDKPNINSKISVENTALDYTSNLKNSMQFSGTIALGYERYITSTFLIGTEIRLGPSREDATINTGFDESITKSTTKYDIAFAEKTSIKWSPQLDLLIKPTIFITPQQALYSIFGIGLTSATVNSTGDLTISVDNIPITTGPQSFTKTIHNIMPVIAGAGYRYFYNSNISAFAEVTGTYNPGFTANEASVPLINEDIILSTNTSPHLIWTAQAGIVYHFA